MGPEELIREGHDETKTQKKTSHSPPREELRVNAGSIMRCSRNQEARLMPNIVAVPEGHRHRLCGNVARGSHLGREVLVQATIEGAEVHRTMTTTSS